MIKLFEAFSGYGAQALALKKYGIEFNHIGISEIEPNAIKAHEAIHGKVKDFGDIKKINNKDREDLEEIDLFTYSFPCQDITRAGKEEGFKEGSNTRSSLIWEAGRIIKLFKPKILMMENVKDLVNKKNKPQYELWLNHLKSLGYNNYWTVVKASKHGIPQIRERVFCVSILNKYDDGSFHFEDDGEENRELYKYLEDNPTDVKLINERYYKKEDKPYYAMVSGEKVFHDRAFLTVVPEGIEVRQATKKGYQLAKIGDTFNMEVPTSAYRRGRVQKNRIATLTTSCDIAVLTKKGPRYLTNKECFRLMGLNDTEIDKIQASGISKSQQYKLAGNSIVVDCMKFLKNLPNIKKEGKL